MRLQVTSILPGSEMLNRYKCTCKLAVNDVVVHPNQGELISCDQAGRIKQWDLSENICTHELVRRSLLSSLFPTSFVGMTDSSR